MCNGITIGGDVSIQISGPCTPTDGSITAAKIGSENAGDGQVLTADGNGGAAWETPTGGGLLFDSVQLTAGSQNGELIDVVIEVRKANARITTPCAVWLIDINTASWWATNIIGGNLIKISSGIWLVNVVAGYLTATLNLSEIPASANIVFVLLDGTLTNPVILNWDEI